MRIEEKQCLIFNEQNSDEECFGLAFRTFVAGISAGFIETITTQPLDVIKTRMQFQSKKQPDNCLIYYKNMFDCIRKIHKHEGFKGYYKGLFAELFSNPPRLALRFSLFEHYNIYLFPENEEPSPPVYALAGIFTGVTESLVLTPFELIKVKMQTNILKYPPGFFHVVQNIIKKDGFGLYGLYRGFDCTMARNTLFGGVYFGVYHTLKNLIPQLENKQIESSLHFVCGFVAAVCAALLNTPLDVVKSKVQGRKMPHFNYLIPTLLYVYRHDRFRGLYQGLLPRILLVGVENGVVMVVYEAIINGLSCET